VGLGFERPRAGRNQVCLVAAGDRFGPRRLAPAYTLPPEIARFSVIHLLQRLADDDRPPRPRNDELATTLADLRRYFDRPGSGNHSPDIKALAERWVAITR
jgi:hypothetical protein